MSSLVLDGFRQHKLRCFLCPRWHGSVPVNSCSYELGILAGMGCVLATHVAIHYDPAGMGGVLSTHIDINFMSLVAWEGFGQHK